MNGYSFKTHDTNNRARSRWTKQQHNIYLANQFLTLTYDSDDEVC